MPQFNISHDYLAQIQAILKLNAPEKEVWAYGSRVNGNSHDASDLDLVIRNPENLQEPVDNFAQLKQAFINSDLPFMVDLMDWAYLPESYREEINKRHVGIWALDNKT